MKRKWPIALLISLVGYFIFRSLIHFDVIHVNQKSEIEKIPTLMDAKGKLDIKVGDFKLDKQPSIGDGNAPVKVIEFSDYKCPACKSWDSNNFTSFKEEFIDTGLVQFYSINFPFLGPDSIEAALAGESIFHQNPDKFWEFHRKLYAQQGDESSIWATEKFLLQFVKENIDGIDYGRFEKDLKEHTYLLNVKEDFKISAANGIYSTPSFIVNGKLVGSNYEELRTLINNSINE